MHQPVEDLSHKGNTFRLRRLRKFLARPVRVWSRRRSSRLCSVTAERSLEFPDSSPDAPRLALMTLPQVQVQLNNFNKGIADFSYSLAMFLRSSMGSMSTPDTQLGFPVEVKPFHGLEASASNAQLGQKQVLAATGTKQLAAAGGLLRVNMYDFALYTDPQHLTAHAPSIASNTTLSTPDSAEIPSPAAPTSSTRPLRLRPRLPMRRRRRRKARKSPPSSPSSPAITDLVRAATPHVAMSLCVRPCRDLPLMMLRTEYSRILRKRLVAVGGSPDDASLRHLLSYFNPAKLPGDATRRGCIRKDAVMLFCRSRKGMLTTTADGKHIVTVHSPKLCEAVFDLYLGQAPVCPKAKNDARDVFQGMVASGTSSPLRLAV